MEPFKGTSLRNDYAGTGIFAQAGRAHFTFTVIPLMARNYCQTFLLQFCP